jgi:hypothetical protein
VPPSSRKNQVRLLLLLGQLSDPGQHVVVAATSFAHLLKADCADVASAKSLYRPATSDRSVIGLSWLTRSRAGCQGVTFEPKPPRSRSLRGVHRVNGN